MSKKNPIFEEIFTVTEIISEFFPKVPRIKAQSDYHSNIEIQLDVNIDLYPIIKGASYRIALATALRDDGVDRGGLYNPEDFEKPSLLDKFEYVMHGKVFKVEEKKEKKELLINASFGGLLMNLKGDPTILAPIPNDSRIYILMKQT